MEFTKENAAESTKHIIEKYYHLNTVPLLSILSEECVWISPEYESVGGADPIKDKIKDGFFMQSFSLEDEEFYVIADKDNTDLVVMGEYSLFSGEQYRKTYVARQNLTFCYRMEDDQYRLYHIHISDKWRIDEKYSYEYGKKKEKKITIETENSTHFVDSDRILYIEAINKSSILHMSNQSITIKKPIKLMEEIFPDHFYRFHRSYLVNCNYVAKIERYFITLATGVTLPIPEKRYMNVRDAITSIMQGKYYEEIF